MLFYGSVLQYMQKLTIRLAASVNNTDLVFALGKSEAAS
jgi:hypothetical protein